MKETLIDIVQDVLSALNSDEVNSIADTEESLQVATTIKETFYNFIDGRNLPHLRKLGQLDHSTTLSLPNYLQVPANYVQIDSVEYDINEDPINGDIEWKALTWCEPDDFLRRTSTYKSSADNVEIVNDPSGAQINILNDANPEYYTSFDDQYIVFNSYNKTVDSTLQNSKSRIVGYTQPSWQMLDGFIPDLPTEMFSAFKQEAINVCFSRFKQMADPTSERNARRGKARMSWRGYTMDGISGPKRKYNYGRRSKK